MHLPPESERGNIEYKLTLNRSKIEELASQLKYRLREGGGIAIYYIGVLDDGTIRGLSLEEIKRNIKVLTEIARKVNAVIVSARILNAGRGLYYAEIIIREENILPKDEINIIALGNVDAGKTTLIGVLTTGMLDDGRGKLIPFIARHPHEIKSGKTSSVTRVLLGFDSEGNIVNHIILNAAESEIARHSCKIVNFIDVGGHEKYLRTTARGFMSSLADYVMYVISYTQALSFERYPMAREHLGLTMVFNIPFFIVFTKKDLVKNNDMRDKAVEKIMFILRKFKYIPIRVSEAKEPIEALAKLTIKRFVPIFEVSNVTGSGIRELVKYLNSLPKVRSLVKDSLKPLLIYIDETWSPRGKGLIVGGLILRGKVKEGSRLLLGPFSDGSWRNIRIKSIRVHDVSVKEAFSGSYVTLAIDGARREEIVKGMVLLDQCKKPVNVSLIKARIWVLHHPTTIRVGYQSVAHIFSIRWPVIFEDIRNMTDNSRILRTGDVGVVKLRFISQSAKGRIFKPRPWYVEKGFRILLRDSRCRAVGIVEEVYP